MSADGPAPVGALPQAPQKPVGKPGGGTGTGLIPKSAAPPARARKPKPARARKPKRAVGGVAALAVLLLLAACARPLTPNETAVARGLFGDTIDTDVVRIKAGVGLLPLPRPRPATAQTGPAVKPPPGLCSRHRSTRRYYDWPAAFVLGNDIYFSYRFYSPDAFAGLPDSAPYPASVLLAHELTHVWQWQNRARTAYTTTGAAGETFAKVDPYWFEPGRAAPFSALGFEQQAAMVQDFTCYALFDPANPELRVLVRRLRPTLPVGTFLSALGHGKK